MKDKVCPKCGAELRWVQRASSIVGCCVCNPRGPVVTFYTKPDTEPWRALQALPGISTEIARALYALGLQTPAAVREATDDVLLSVPGIGKMRLAKIRSLTDQ